MTWEARVLMLFNVPQCGACDGTGLDPGPYACVRCGGAGRTLQDARREDWPWYRTERVTEDEGDSRRWSRLYMPDFEQDGQAAVKLAQKVLAEVEFCDLLRYDEGHWEMLSYGYGDGPEEWAKSETLGGLLIKALTRD